MGNESEGISLGNERSAAPPHPLFMNNTEGNGREQILPEVCPYRYAVEVIEARIAGRFEVGGLFQSPEISRYRRVGVRHAGGCVAVGFGHDASSHATG